MIKKFMQVQEEKRQEILQKKVYSIREHLTKFFDDLATSRDEVTIPAWMECKRVMEELEINKDNPKIVGYYYRKLQRQGLV